MSATFRTRAFAIAAAAIAATVGVSACSGSSSSGNKSIKLIEYSVPKPAYDALGAAFKKTAAGKGVTINASYGPSGSQSKAVAGGQRADYVGFSVEPDLTNLVPAKVAKGWDSGATKGVVSHSVVVLVVRKGNPLHITGWDDLVKPGVKIVTPDPASSGSAKWNLLAAYQHVISQGGSPADAKAYVQKFFSNVTSRASSGAVASTQFQSGTGNVLISYEDEAINTRQKGGKIDYIVPQQSVLIENPAAVTKNATAVSKKFLSFVKSDKGQQIFAGKGFRPVSDSTKVGTVAGANDPSNPFPKVAQLTTVAQLGGWSKVNDKFFGPDGIVTKIESA